MFPFPTHIELRVRKVSLTPHAIEVGRQSTNFLRRALEPGRNESCACVLFRDGLDTAQHPASAENTTDFSPLERVVGLFHDRGNNHKTGVAHTSTTGHHGEQHQDGTNHGEACFCAEWDESSSGGARVIPIRGQKTGSASSTYFSASTSSSSSASKMSRTAVIGVMGSAGTLLASTQLLFLHDATLRFITSPRPLFLQNGTAAGSIECAVTLLPPLSCLPPLSFAEEQQLELEILQGTSGVPKPAVRGARRGQQGGNNYSPDGEQYAGGGSYPVNYNDDDYDDHDAVEQDEQDAFFRQNSQKSTLSAREQQYPSLPSKLLQFDLEPPSGDEHDCQLCFSTGFVPCTKCQACGYLVCTVCDGRGVFACENCDNRGYLQEDAAAIAPNYHAVQAGGGSSGAGAGGAQAASDSSVCAVCVVARLGRRWCEDCWGEAKACANCVGLGKIRCPTCSGTTRARCPRCYGLVKNDADLKNKNSMVDPVTGEHYLPT
ncbi:unnamed protein product [Amoebophrya sp. A120]|nr:unnamed protein product [Amoebophrya sp. A120]|eukprot:GSA120T00000286001.1